VSEIKFQVSDKIVCFLVFSTVFCVRLTSTIL